MPVSGHGIEAWIEVEGKRLKEFQKHVDVSVGEPRIICWVPCELGKVSEAFDTQQGHSFITWPMHRSLQSDARSHPSGSGTRTTL